MAIQIEIATLLQFSLQYIHCDTPLATRAVATGLVAAISIAVGDAGGGAKEIMLDVLPLSHHDRDGSVMIHLAKVRFTGLRPLCLY